jgi:hypothetical protein
LTNEYCGAWFYRPQGTNENYHHHSQKQISKALYISAKTKEFCSSSKEGECSDTSKYATFTSVRYSRKHYLGEPGEVDGEQAVGGFFVPGEA